MEAKSEGQWPVDHPTVVLIEREFRRLNAVLDGLSREQMERPVFDPEFEADPWTVKDLLVHMAAWKRNVIRIVERLRQDPSWVPPEGTTDDALGIDFNEFNREVFTRWQGRSLEEALNEHHAAHQELLAAMGSLSPDLIPLPVSRNIWPFAAIWHVKAHRVEIMDSLDNGPA